MCTEVTIEQGTLRGFIGKDLRGNDILKFKGIPYAKPPLGELRFKAPVPAEKWSGILDATKEGDICYSRNPFEDNKLSGSENCLVLNVYTKRLPKNEKDLRPVLFWIHGGAYIMGSGSETLYGPDFLLTEDIVLVTFNYRLGFLGFLSLDDPSLEIPGNAGMKDQVMALKWVQTNISKFGGDPNNVTIFGESAGASSVHLLLLSPLAKGLFHKAIAQSGCALNPWLQGTRGSKPIAQVLGLEGKDDKTIYKALMEKSTEELFALQEQLLDNFSANQLRPVSVVVERKSETAFLDDEPINIMLSGNFNHVPYITGYTSSEGMVLEIFKRPGEPDILDFQAAIPWSFGYDTTKVDAVAKKIKSFYFGDQEYSTDTLDQKYDLMTDYLFLYGIHSTTLIFLHQLKAPVYLYKVVIETELNYFKKFIKVDRPGVSHCDDLGYLFKLFATPEIQPGSIEDVSLSRFVKLWTNFAKFGNPTPDKNDQLLNVEWKPVTDTNLDYLEIGEVLKAKTNPDSERANFWKKLFAESPAGQKSQCQYLKSAK